MRVAVGDRRADADRRVEDRARSFARGPRGSTRAYSSVRSSAGAVGSCEWVCTTVAPASMHAIAVGGELVRAHRDVRVVPPARDPVQRGLDDHRSVRHDAERTPQRARTFRRRTDPHRSASHGDAERRGRGRWTVDCRVSRHRRRSSHDRIRIDPRPRRAPRARTRRSSTARRAYFDDLAVDGHAPRGVRALDDRPRRGRSRSTPPRPAAMPGVVAVYTGDDLGLDAGPGLRRCCPPSFNRPPLAKDRVRFVGDIVAAVVAETRAQAVDAAEQVIVDYDPLPAVVDAEAALADGAPLLFPEHGSNLAIEFDFGAGPDRARRRRRRGQGPLREPARSPRCRWSRTGSSSSPTARAGSLCHVPTQAPHGVASRSPRRPGSSEEQVRVVAPAVGGGFGAKTGHVRRVRGRGEGRARARPAGEVDRDPLREHGRDDPGPRPDPARRDGPEARRHDHRRAGARSSPTAARTRRIGAFLPFLTRTMSQGVYAIPKVEFTSWSAATNTTPTAAYRGAGPPGGDHVPRAHHRHGRRRARHRPGRDPQAELHPARGVPAHDGDRRELRRRRVRQGARRGVPRSPATTSCAPSRRRGASAATSASSASASPPTSRSPPAGCSRSTARSR